MKKISDYLNIKESANILGVSPGTLRNWVKLRLIKCYRHPLNKYRLFLKEDLEELLSEIKK